MADDELNSPELPSDNQAENQNQFEVEESRQSEDGVTELEDLVAEKDEELTKANACIIELEQTVATLQQAVAESEEKLTVSNHALDEAVASYKAMVVQANPEVIEELITGDTIETITESLEKAKTLVDKVRQGLETEILLAKIPAGAPERTSPDLSALSPREKIQYGIGGKR